MLNHRVTPPKSKEIFLEKENKDCYKLSKIKIKIIYKLNCQSNIPQFLCWLTHPSSSFPLFASPLTYPPKPIIGNFNGSYNCEISQKLVRNFVWASTKTKIVASIKTNQI
ncbi:hypothetical protein ACJW31_06G054900 [Castanea mollissima]